MEALSHQLLQRGPWRAECRPGHQQQRIQGLVMGGGCGRAGGERGEAGAQGSEPPAKSGMFSSSRSRMGLPRPCAGCVPEQAVQGAGGTWMWHVCRSVFRLGFCFVTWLWSLNLSEPQISCLGTHIGLVLTVLQIPSSNICLCPTPHPNGSLKAVEKTYIFSLF